MDPNFELARRAMDDLARHSLMMSARPDAPVRPVRPSRLSVLRSTARRLVAFRLRLPSRWPRSSPTDGVPSSHGGRERGANAAIMGAWPE